MARAGLAATVSPPALVPRAGTVGDLHHYLELSSLPWVAGLAFLIEHESSLRGLLSTGKSLFAAARRPVARADSWVCSATSSTRPFPRTSVVPAVTDRAGSHRARLAVRRLLDFVDQAHPAYNSAYLILLRS